ncbi:hypothetical protein BU25DRAFT_311756, partial [Macroventuria anomochaeta]
ATHTLQPLDVVCFKPLAQNYTKELDIRNQKTQGKAPIKKSNFFNLFWKAWTQTFTKTLVLKSISATGIWPQNSDIILHRFTTQKPTTPEPQAIQIS